MVKALFALVERAHHKSKTNEMLRKCQETDRKTREMNARRRNMTRKNTVREMSETFFVVSFPRGLPPTLQK